MAIYSEQAYKVTVHRIIIVKFIVGICRLQTPKKNNVQYKISVKTKVKCGKTGS